MSWGKYWKNPQWCLYDNMNGKIILKHPYREELTIPCPYCGKTLVIEKYKAECCGKTFKVGFGEIRQIEPVGTHNKKKGRGWASLRPFKKEALN